MRTPTRRRAGALLVLVLLVCHPVLAASPAPADAIADKQAEAERIARQLEQQSRQVSVLAEDYDEARVRIAAVAEELADAGAKVEKTDAQASAIRRRLKQQAVASYMRGGSAQAMSLLADTRGTEEFAVRSHYVRTITAGAGEVLDELRAVRLRLDDQRARLDDARAEAEAVAALAEQKRQEAAAAAAAQQRTLRQVQGELAVLVEAEATRRAEEEAKRAAAEIAARKAKAEAAAAAAATAAAAKEAAARETAAREAATREAARQAATTTTTKATVAGAGPIVTTRPTTTTTTTRPTTTTTTKPASAPSGGGTGAPAAGADAAIAEARRQLGKPYEWGGSGPDTFDCSGLTSWAWRAGGKRLSHSSRVQWTETSRVAIDDLQPGDLVFYGDPIHHVGLYIGDGQMIEAPETGKNVRIGSIYRSGYVGAGRVN